MTISSSLQRSQLRQWLMLLAATVVISVCWLAIANANTPTKPIPITPIVKDDGAPKIQLAILLDTSSSMSGLIDQTRNQLWQVVNEFAHTKKNGQTSQLEVAVYEYGNSQLSATTGYIRQLTDLTTELEEVSAALFSLTTNGGDEYCGYAIHSAVTQLNWSADDDDIKVIFIAGNEPFTQGPIAFASAIEQASAKGISVNTIHAGPYELGVQTGWQQGALLAGGNYMSIDHNHQVAHIVAPQDRELAQLNAQLNDTYIPYGKDGKVKASRQQAQDKANSDISLGLLAKRAVSKASSLYKNQQWDLVDALESEAVDLKALKPEALPAPMATMSLEEKQDYIAAKREQRKQLKASIQALSKERQRYIVEQQAKAPEPTVSTMQDALSESIRQESERKGFVTK